MKAYIIDLYVVAFELSRKWNPGSESSYAIWVCVFNVISSILNLFQGAALLFRGRGFDISPGSPALEAVVAVAFWIVAQLVAGKLVRSSECLSSTEWIMQRNVLIDPGKKWGFFVITIVNFLLIIILSQASFLSRR